MARMIPPELETDTFGNYNIGEKKVYEELRYRTPENWVVRSNLRCSFVETFPQRRLREVESDFVVLVPKKGLVFLEVKSSREFNCSKYGTDACNAALPVQFCCMDAVWSRITNGVTVRLEQNPFSQAWEAKGKQMEALCNNILGTANYKEKFPGVYAHLVVYPQGKIREGAMPLQAPCTVVTAKDMPNLQQKIEDIIAYYPDAYLPQDIFNKIVKYFEAEVHIDALSIDPETLETEIARLTGKQKEIAGRLLTEDGNFIVHGCCGSGKTMLAVWLLKHKVAEGKKVLFLCFNRMLAASLRIKLGDGYEIQTINQLIASLANRAGVEYNFENVDDIFLQACNNLGDNLPKYDVIIIDEAQDIHSENQFFYLDFLANRDCRKYIFADPKQNVYRNQQEKPAYENWEAQEITLDKNCRNTKLVAAYVKEIKETETSVFEDAPDGIAPQICSPRQNTRELLQKTVNNLLSGKDYPWPASSIAILVLGIDSLNSLENMTFHNNIGTACYHSEQRNEEDVLKDWYSAKKIIVSTVQSFKGLEADNIILYNFDSEFNGGDESVETLAYVGASRPRGALYIIPANQKSREFAEQFLR